MKILVVEDNPQVAETIMDYLELAGHRLDCAYHGQAALQLLAVMRRANQEISELASILTLSPQCLVNVEVARRPPLKDLPGVQAAIAAAEKELGQDGRVLVRYSGTQNMCRVMVEGPTEDMTTRLTHAIAEAIKKEIG